MHHDPAQPLHSAVVPSQDAFTAFERCRAPVVAAVQGACIGAGIDLITACDIRCCTAGATFCVKEVDLGITADLGTLQRLFRLVGEGELLMPLQSSKEVPQHEGDVV